MTSLPHFERSISMNDLDSSLKVREHVQQDIVNPEDDSKHCYLQTASQFTFVLRSFKDFSVDFKKFLYSNLVDLMVFRDLEECRRLNWCSALHPMVPVLTQGDGNCLMHSASKAMWAVSDRYHTLRKLVYSALLEDVYRFYHKRWQREHEISNLSRHGYEMTEEQWTKEWQIVLELVSQSEYPLGKNGAQFSSLEEIHIFVLANVLRRTIIVVSNDIQRDNYDEPLTPLNFPGIYLPLKWDPVDCVKTPLVIGYSQGHFAAIVSFEDGIFDRGETMDGDNARIHGVPLTQMDGNPLPVHFLFKDEVDLQDGLLRQYLDCTKVRQKNPYDDSDLVTLVARLHFMKPPGCIAGLVDHFFTSANDAYNLMVRQKSEQPGCQTPSLTLKPCKTEGCEFYGTYESFFYCSKCLEVYLKKEPSSATGARTTVLPNNGNEDSLLFGLHQQQINKPQQRQQTVTQSLELDKKCATNGCKYQAMPENGNLCIRCKESEGLAELQPESIQSINAEATLCVNTGCKFHGIPQQEGFCSNCYKVFCREMQSLIIEENHPPRGHHPPQEHQCQTHGCNKPACPELYDRCVECYGECIKLFIQTHEGKSIHSLTATTPSNPPSVLSSSKHCITSGCQNEGQEAFNGRCQHCFQIRPYSGPFAKERLPNVNNEAENENLISFSEQPPSNCSILYCETPKCGQPLGEVAGTLCTKCLMSKFQLELEISPQQLPPTVSEKNEPSGEELERNERAAEVLRARQQLEPLYIPPHGVQKPVANPGNPENSSTLTEEAGAPRNFFEEITRRAEANRASVHVKPLSISPHEVQAPGANNPGNKKPGNSSTLTGEAGAAANTPQASGTHCLTPNCSFFANPETQFLCTFCYKKEKEEWEKITKMAQRQRPSPKPQLKFCAFENCPYRESPGNGGLCDRCFQIGIRNERVWNTAIRRQPPREPQRPQPVLKPKSSYPRKSTNFINAGAPCKIAGCLKFGTPKTDGYCEKCFEKQKRRQELNPTSTAAPSLLINLENEQHGTVSNLGGLGLSPYEAPSSSTNFGSERPGRNSAFTGHGIVLVSAYEEGSSRFPIKCAREGCNMTGSAQLRGYCSECFQEFIRCNDSPESVIDLPLENDPTSQARNPDQEPVSTGLTTLSPTSPKTCAMPNCDNQVQPSTMSHCRDCLAKLYPQYTLANRVM